MTTKIFLATTLLCFLSYFSWAKDDSYQAPEVKLNTKSNSPHKMKSDDWDSEYRVHSKPTKMRGVASEPDTPEKVESMSARYPSSVDEDGVYKVKQDEQQVAPIFWKYKSDE